MRILNCCLVINWLLVLFSCRNQSLVEFNPTDTAIVYHGRTLVDKDVKVILVGSASYGEFIFSGDSCIVLLKNIAHSGDHNYVSIEVDNAYAGRLKVDSNIVRFFPIIAKTKATEHLLRIYKATEAANGQVAITGIRSLGLKSVSQPVKKKIEFIGNSITCGFGNDTTQIPCGQGMWYDKHNAYWAYGPRIARALDLDFMLSSVSGIGIYRNWNSDGPAMPQVYESSYLDLDSSLRWNFSRYVPDITSICLGTNDLSDGDGTKPRKAFDSAIYIKGYIEFINTIYKYYPSTQVALLTSPMLSGKKADLLLTCLKSIQKSVGVKHPDKIPIQIFSFGPMIPKGCDYHPDIHDHEVMANEAIPFFKDLLQKPVIKN